MPASKWFLVPVAILFLFSCVILGDVLVSEFKILTRPFANIGVQINIGIILVLVGFASYFIYAAFHPKKLAGIYFYQKGLFSGEPRSFTKYSDLEVFACTLTSAEEIARFRNHFRIRLMISIFALNPSGIGYAYLMLKGPPTHSTAVFQPSGQREIRVPLQINEHIKLMSIFPSQPVAN